MSEATPHLFQVGDWRADANQNLMWHGSQKVHLEPKAMAILQYLVINANEVISRKELFDKFWKNQVVTEDALNRAMWNIRRSLGDTPNKPKYISTIRNRGYKLIAPITFFEDPRIEKHEKSVQKNIEDISASLNITTEPTNTKEVVSLPIETTSSFYSRLPAWKIVFGSAILTTLIIILFIAIMNNTTKLSDLTIYQARLTPDKRRIIYIDANKSGIWIWDRFNAANMLTNTLPDFSKSWFVDNNSFYYLTAVASTNQSKLWRIDFTSKEPQLLGFYFISLFSYQGFADVSLVAQ